MRRLEVWGLAIRVTKSAILLHMHSPYTVRASAWYCIYVRALLESAMAWWLCICSQDGGGWGSSPVVANFCFVFSCVSLEREIWYFALVIAHNMHQVRTYVHSVIHTTGSCEEVSLWVRTCLLFITAPRV